MTDQTSSEINGNHPSNKIACFDCPARMSDLCQGLSDLNLPALYQSSTHMDFAKGSTISLDGEDEQYVFNVREGLVKMSRLGASGQRQIVGFLFSGDLFGVTPGQEHGLCAEAVSPVKLCRWERKKFEDLLVLFPAMDKQYHSIMSKLLGETMDLAYALGQLTADQRLAGFLLHMADRQKGIGQPEDEIRLDMSRTDIADYLGLKIETVSRGLSKMKAEGIIKIPSQRLIQIADRPKLKAIELEA